MDRGLSYIKGNSDIPLLEVPLGVLIGESLEKHGDIVLISSIEQKKKLTAIEFLEELDNFAAGLYEIGLKRGDKIGVMLNNSIEAFIVIFGCFRGGFPTVLLNPALQPQELEYFLKTIGITCIISTDTFKKVSLMDMLLTIIPEIEDSYSNIIESKCFPSLKHVIVISEKQYSGTSNFETIRALGKQTSKLTLKNNQKQINSQDLSLIIFTSGTTGLPKIAGHSHYVMVNGLYLLSLRLTHFQPSRKLCFNLPLFHLFGFLFASAAIFRGVTVVLPSLYYNPRSNLRTISEEKCTYIMGTPTILADLIGVQRELKLPLSPYMAICGGAIGPSNLYKCLLEELNIKEVKTGYGMTETISITWTLPERFNDFRSVGAVIDHIDIKIVDNDGNIVPVGTTGLLYVRGYSVIKKYLYNDVQVLDDDGWFNTGDAVYLDNDGNIYIAGRIKDIINRGGEKISPAEVEITLGNHPDILEIHVIGSKHERFGEEVCACLKVKPGCCVTLDEIKCFCKGKLSYYKIPSRLEIMEDFPKTLSGKIQKAKLTEQINKKCNCNTVELNRG